MDSSTLNFKANLKFSQFFGGERPPNFLEWDYKIQPDSDHVAKFQGDRSRELGGRLAKQKKHHG